jgi:glycerol-3-phosphate dehydrogenase
MSNVVEGVDTARAVHLLAIGLGLDLPMMETIYGVIAGEELPGSIAGHFLNGHEPAQTLSR